MITNLSLVLTLLVVLAAAAIPQATISHEDLTKLVEGILTGANVKEDHATLLKCLNDGVAEDWEGMVYVLKETEWNDPQNLIMKFIEFNVPPYESFKLLLRCSKSGEVQELMTRIDKLTGNLSEFGMRVIQRMPQLVHDLKDFLAKWTAEKFLEAGKTAGTTIGWFFADE